MSHRDTNRSTNISLAEIRETLERAEDSIIFALLERSQYLDQTNSSVSLDLLKLTEIAQAQAGRYACPEETPFTCPDNSRYSQYQSETPPTHRLDHYLSAHHYTINYNAKLLQYYFSTLLPNISEAGQDPNPGSAAVADIALLQAVSRRIHLGKVVGESKLRRDATFGSLQNQSDQDILDHITDEPREKVVMDRVTRKAEQYLAVFQTSHHPSRLTPKSIATFFHEFIIPVTKAVQVDYLRPTVGIVTQTN